MHGGGHAGNKGVTRLNFGNVGEKQMDLSGFPTRRAWFGRGQGNGFARGKWVRAGWGQVVAFCLDWGWKMGSFGKRGFARRRAAEKAPHGVWWTDDGAFGGGGPASAAARGAGPNWRRVAWH